MLILVAAPTAPVVMDSEAAHYLRLDEPQFDVLTILIGAATRYFDGPGGALGRAMTSQTYDLVLDNFPSGYIDLGLPPVQTPITHIKYLDEAGALQTWGSTNYTLDAARGLIHLAYGIEYPVTRDVPNAVTVRFVTGPAEATPEDKALVLQRVAYYHENREAAQEDLLNTRRVWSVG